MHFSFLCYSLRWDWNLPYTRNDCRHIFLLSILVGLGCLGSCFILYLLDLSRLLWLARNQKVECLKSNTSDFYTSHEKLALQDLEQEFAVTVLVRNEARQRLKQGLLKSAQLEFRFLVRAAVHDPLSNSTLIASEKDGYGEAKHYNDFLDFRKFEYCKREKS